jgi:hypothetical protein
MILYLPFPLKCPYCVLVKKHLLCARLWTKSFPSIVTEPYDSPGVQIPDRVTTLPKDTFFADLQVQLFIVLGPQVREWN